jgi:hypothetical protein
MEKKSLKYKEYQNEEKEVLLTMETQFHVEGDPFQSNSESEVMDFEEINEDDQKRVAASAINSTHLISTTTTTEKDLSSK